MVKSRYRAGGVERRRADGLLPQDAGQCNTVDHRSGAGPSDERPLEGAVDLSADGELALRDRGYFGMCAEGVDFTMVREPPINLSVSLTKCETG